MTIEFWQVILITLIPAAFGAFGAWLSIRGQAGKVKADAADTLTDTAMGLLAPLRTEIERLERRLAMLENVIVAKEADIVTLKARVLLLEGVISDKDKSISERDLKISTLETKVCQLEGEVAAMRAQLPEWKPGDGERRQA